MGTFMPSDFSAGYSHPLSLIAATDFHIQQHRRQKLPAKRRGGGKKRQGQKTPQTHLEPLEEVQFSWSTVPFGGDERGWRRKGKEQCLPRTQHPLQNSWQGFRQQRTRSPWYGKGSSRPPSSCSLNHGFRLPWGMVPDRAKTTPHPCNLLPVFTPFPACFLPVFKYAEVETALATTLNSTQPFLFWGRAALTSQRLQSQYRAVGELSGPTQIRQRGYLPSAKQDDAGHVQRHKAHPACFGCSSLALVQG